LKSRGIQVVRFRNEEIWEDIGAVLTKIEQVICESK
jgi:very-short-patch-repair endonuclease